MTQFYGESRVSNGGRKLSAFSLAGLAMAIAWCSAWVPGSRADDWPQWMGPQRDGVWRETGIVETFPSGGPKVRWRTAIGSGYAGPAVAQGRVYVLDRQLSSGQKNPDNSFERGKIPGLERVLCLNETDGTLLWTHEYNCPYDISYPAGPRTTPVVHDGKVYALGAVGNLVCLDAVTGALVWSHDFKKELGVESPTWGFAGHPLIEGDRLICLARGDGSTVLAFDKNTGKELWRALSAREPGYSAPVVCEAGGKRQLIVWHPESLNSLDPETGRVYWSIPLPIQQGLAVATPRRAGQDLLVTAFYDGSLLVRLAESEPAATQVWRIKGKSERNPEGLHGLMCTPFIEDGYIYGVCSYGQFRCLKADTGERVWETYEPTGGQPLRWANAFMVKNGSRFFLFNEKGDLIIARLNPQRYQEMSRAHLLEPTNTTAGRPVVWSHPAFANRCVYARNDQEILCASLAAESRPRP